MAEVGDTVGEADGDRVGELSVGEDVGDADGVDCVGEVVGE